MIDFSCISQAPIKDRLMLINTLPRTVVQKYIDFCPDLFHRSPTHALPSSRCWSLIATGTWPSPSPSTLLCLTLTQSQFHWGMGRGREAKTNF